MTDRVKFLFGLAVLVIAGFSLWDAWKGPPVAAAFTRVGGPTRVETAIEASRFWLEPPAYVVKTPAHGSDAIRLGAAECAIRYDAPLLLTSPKPDRKRLVERTIATWRERMGALRVLEIWDKQDVMRCQTIGDRNYANGLSTLGVPDLKLNVRTVTAKDLAEVLVFAAAQSPHDQPDVAVGLALAAHITREDRPVSLVVVPRYLEADSELEKDLRERRVPVTGGIVLGQTGVVPDDTRALLRQVLQSTGRSRVLGPLQGALGSLEALLLALLALFGAGTAVQGAREFFVRQRNERRPEMPVGPEKKTTPGEPRLSRSPWNFGGGQWLIRRHPPWWV